MTLLNGLLAFGAAAFALPLLIHLLNRNRFQIVDWGAMQFLQSSRNLSSRRLQWKQLLLLLLRCALPVLLALAMARPLFYSLLSADGRSAVSLAIVVDDSLSMFASETNGADAGTRKATRFSVACQAAVNLLEGLPPGSNATFLLGGSMPDALTEQVPDLLVPKVRDLQKRTIPAGPFSLEESIRRSLQWLSNSPNPRRQIVLISDFQRHEWADDIADPMLTVAKLVAAQTIPTELSFLWVGAGPDTVEPLSDNLSLDSLEVSPSNLVIDREASLSVTIANHGNAKTENVHVTLSIDGVEFDRQEVVIVPNSNAQFRSRWTPKRIGDHLLVAKILRDDTLMADNVLSTVAIVQEPFPILLIDGDIRNEPMQSETDFLRLALSPFSILSGRKGDTFSSKTISIDQLTESMLKGMRAVCLCNVREVSETQQRWLRKSVEEGCGLMVFLGDRVNTEHYQRWASAANNGLRISLMSSREKTRTDTGRPSTGNSIVEDEEIPSSRIQTQSISFSPIRDMSSLSLSSLAGVRFDHRVPLQLDANAVNSASDASIAMRYEDGQAFMLEARIGQGRCLWVSCACDDDDSNLPTRAVFVPFIQKLATYVCRADVPMGRFPENEPWLRTLRDLQTKKPLAKANFVVAKPDGTEVSVQLTDEGLLRFNDTRLLGTYTAAPVRLESENPPVGEILDNALEHRAVGVRGNSSVLGKESQLESIGQDEIKTLATLGHATLALSAKELLEQTRSNWHGREAWTWLWLLVVFCFVAEMALEQSFSRHSRMSVATLASLEPRGTAA